MKKYSCLRESFLAKIAKIRRSRQECWMWSQRPCYGRVQWRSHGDAAHRYSWKHFNKLDIPEGMVVMHTCDNPPCVNPWHLKLGTHSDNLNDCRRKRRRSPKPKNYNSWNDRGHSPQSRKLQWRTRHLKKWVKQLLVMAASGIDI